MTAHLYDDPDTAPDDLDSAAAKALAMAEESGNEAEAEIIRGMLRKRGHRFEMSVSLQVVIDWPCWMERPNLNDVAGLIEDSLDAHQDRRLDGWGIKHVRKYN